MTVSAVAPTYSKNTWVALGIAAGWTGTLGATGRGGAAAPARRCFPQQDMAFTPDLVCLRAQDLRRSSRLVWRLTRASVRSRSRARTEQDTTTSAHSRWSQATAQLAGLPRCSDSRSSRAAHPRTRARLLTQADCELPGAVLVAQEVADAPNTERAQKQPVERHFVLGFLRFSDLDHEAILAQIGVTPV